MSKALALRRQTRNLLGGLRLVVLLVTAVSVSPLLLLVNGQLSPKLGNDTGYPICPNGNPPKQPAVALRRCPAYIGMTCCDNCEDLNGALSLANANLYDVFQSLDPAVLSKVPVAILGNVSHDTMVCDTIALQQQCTQRLDDLVCAASCDPNAGAYVKQDEFLGSTVIAVCSSEADAIFEACKDMLAIPGRKGGTADLRPYFSDTPTFMTQIVGGILRQMMRNDKVQMVITTTNCIAGKLDVFPPETSCCATFSSIPPTCTFRNDLTTLLNRATPPACLAATSSTPVPITPSSSPPLVLPAPSTPPAAVSPVPSKPPKASTPNANASAPGATTPATPATPSPVDLPRLSARQEPSPSTPVPIPEAAAPKAGSPAAAAYISIINVLVCGVMALLAPTLL